MKTKLSLDVAKITELIKFYYEEQGYEVGEIRIHTFANVDVELKEKESV
jgi:hypothetical protein